MTTLQDEKTPTYLLSEPHEFNNGDEVNVTLRYDDAESYNGRIYNIVSLSINKYNKIEGFTDHFYINFDAASYYHIIQRGWGIIYNYKPETVADIVKENGRITKITIKNGHFSEAEEADINNINAILIWRVAWKITKNLPYAVSF